MNLTNDDDVVLVGVRWFLALMLAVLLTILVVPVCVVLYQILVNVKWL